MKVLLLKDYFYPEQCAGIQLTNNLLQGFSKSGLESEVFVPIPCRGIDKKMRKAYQKKKNEVLYDGKVKLHRYWLPYERKNTLLRAVRYLLQNIRQFFKGLTCKNVDIVFLGSTPPTNGIVGGWLKKAKKIPFVYNVQDIFPDSMVTAGITKKGSFLWKIGNKIANKTYKRADKIIVISEEMRDNLLSKGVPSEKIEIVYNWVDEEVIHPVQKEDNRLIEELNIPQYDFSVVYAGNLGRAQSVETIIEAAELLKTNPEIGFYIFGDGANKEAIKKSIIEKGLTRVHMYPLQPYERVSEVYSLGDASIVACKAGTGGNALPSKTWSIMACGKPVLVCFDKGTMLERLAVEQECGLFAEAENAQALSENILLLSSDKAKCERLGENARDYIETYLTKKSCTTKIVQILVDTKAQFNEEKAKKAK